MKITLKKVIFSFILSLFLTFIVSSLYSLNNEYIDLTNKQNQAKDILYSEGEYITNSNDSWFKIGDIKSNSSSNIKLNINNLNKDITLSIYYAIGDNFSESKRVDYNLKAGDNYIEFNKKENFDTIRIDLGSEKGIKFNIGYINLYNGYFNNNFIYLTFLIFFILIYVISIIVDILKYDAVNKFIYISTIALLSYILTSIILFDGNIYIPKIDKYYKSEVISSEYILNNSKDFKLKDNVLLSLSDDPFIIINNTNPNYKYLLIDVEELSIKNIRFKIYFGVNGKYSEDKSKYYDLKNGKNIIRFDLDGYNSLRIDLVDKAGVSIKLNEMKIMTNLYIDFIFIVFFVVLSLLIYLFISNINSIKKFLILLRENIIKNEKIVLIFINIAIFLISVYSILNFESSKKYRLISVGIISYIIIYFIIFKVRNIYKSFIILSILLGLVFSILVPPMQTPDDEVHILRSYYLSEGNFKYSSNMYIPSYLDRYIKFNDYEKFKFKYTKKVDLEKFKETINYSTDNDVNVYHSDGKRTGNYLMLAYLPQAIGMSVAKLLNLSPYYLILFGRLSNLLLWIFICILALKLIPIKKKLMMSIMLLPMSIHQAASLSPDAILNSFSFLFISYVLYIKFKKDKVFLKDIIMLILPLIPIVSVKLPYILISILILTIPNHKFGNTLNYKNLIHKFIYLIFMFLIPFIFFIINKKFMVEPVIPSEVSNSANFNLISSILGNIDSYISIIIETIKYKCEFYIRNLVGIFGWLDAPLPRFVINSMVISIFIYAILHKDKKFNINLKDRCIFFIILSLFIVMLITVGIAWAKDDWVNMKIIEGIQGRYFIPFIALLPFICINNKVIIINRKIDNKLVDSILMNNVALIYSISILVLLYRYWIS